MGGYWGGVASSALQEYAVPGRGGRMPVALTLPDPALRARPLDRTPVVVVPDTAVAAHPWFTDGSRLVRLELKDGHLVPVRPTPPAPPPATSGGAPSGTAAPSSESLTSTPPPSEPVGLLQGHATFIAGLVRQGCPEATIVSIPVMGDDGVVDESVMLDVLQALLDRHVHGQQSGPESDVVDVLSLSLGYYAEDRTYTSGPVADLLDRFAEHGVLVVAGVGNDGTTAPFVPAALAADPPKRVTAKSVPPLASVGATNPDGVTVALFSTTCPSSARSAPVSRWSSTLPLTNGMGQPSSQVTTDGTVRCTVDPDDYTGGFGVWSGTSFSAPVFAAELAAALIEQGDLTDVSSSRHAQARHPRLAHLHRKGEVMTPTPTAPDGLGTLAGKAFAAYRAGERERLSELVDLVTPVLWNAARSQGGSPATCEDAIQTALPPARPRRVDQRAGGGARVARRRRQARGVAPGARLAPRDRRRRGARGPDAAARPRGAVDPHGAPTRAVDARVDPFAAVPGAAPGHRVRRPARLRGHRAVVGDAGRQHRPDPWPVPAEAEDDPRLRPRMGGLT